MDIDAFIATNRHTWERLRNLSTQASRGVRRLDADELDELLVLYQSVSGHLSIAQTQYGDTGLISELTSVLALARGVIYRRRTQPVAAFRSFFTEAFPAAIWYLRRYVLVAALALLGPSLIVGIWLGNNETARNSTMDQTLAENIASTKFEEYYSSAPAAAFQSQITTNNIQVSFMAFAFGVLLGLPTLYLLVTNGMNLGAVGAVMHHYGQGGKFWGLILPHGLLEISAIIIAGAAGLALAWSIISPGDRTRRDSLAEQGSRSIVVIMGLVLAFVTAGLIEAWITPSGLPTWARVGVGVIVAGLFWSYVLVLGRGAAWRGLTGIFGEQPTAGPSRSEPVTAAPSI